MGETQINSKLIIEHGLSEEEYERIYNILHREPTITELGIFSVMWSEHCSYKSSRSSLKLLPSNFEHVVIGPGENAGVIDIGNNIWIVFKIESHNHPSAIEPYQGAATGVGGILRDIFTMGARPIAILNSLRFGNPTSNHAKYLLQHVIAGIAGYGNCVGVPTVGGEVYFDNVYENNPLVNVMCVGLITNKNIVKAIATGEGNPVIYVGSATGRDGIKGASFASKELTEKSHEDRPAVQVGDPFVEKLLLEACLELSEKDYLIGMQDMGAAGLTCSTCEMAAKGNAGIEIELSLVPRRAENMTPYEIMLSESQERMLVCVKKGYEDEVKKIFEKWGLHAMVIGRVTRDGMLRVKDKGKIVAEIPTKALVDDSPVYHRPEKMPEYIRNIHKISAHTLPEIHMSYNDILLQLLSSPTISNKVWIYQQYDHMVRTNTVIYPGEADASVLRIKGEVMGIALTTDGNGRYCYLAPYIGGMIAVAEAARNLVCVGAKPLAITNCLNFGNPTVPEIMWQFRQVINGMKDVCNELKIPVTGGNVSFYNESEYGAVYPTPVIGMVGLISDISITTDMGFKTEGDIIVLLGEIKDELGGSEYLKIIHNILDGEPPELDIKKEKAIQQVCLTAFNKGIIKSAHDCAEGGIAVALAECCIQGKYGAEIEILQDNIHPVSMLFGETQSRIIVTVDNNNLDTLIEIITYENIPYSILGEVRGKNLIINKFINLPVSKMEAVYKWIK